MFQVGQRVVCIDAIGPLTSGATYTIQKMKRGPFWLVLKNQSIDSALGVKVFEVTLDEYTWFDAKRFALATERKTDISVFTKILKLIMRKWKSIRSGSAHI